MIKHLILPLLLLAAPLRGQTTEEYRTYLRTWEGETYAPVHKAREVTVGIGHNLLANHQTVQPFYTQHEVDTFFVHDLAVALEAARRGVVGFDQLPKDARLVVIDVIWTCGPTGFMRFKAFRHSMSDRFYRGAAVELIDSVWFKEEPAARVNDHLRRLRALP